MTSITGLKSRETWVLVEKKGPGRVGFCVTTGDLWWFVGTRERGVGGDSE